MRHGCYIDGDPTTGNGPEIPNNEPENNDTEPQNNEPEGEPGPEKGDSGDDPGQNKRTSKQDPEFDRVAAELRRARQEIEALKRQSEEEHKSAAQQARDAVIAEMGYEWKGKPITTEAEYKQALKEKQLADSLRQQYSNVPDDLSMNCSRAGAFVKNYSQKEGREEAERKAQEEKEFLPAATLCMKNF
jgi:hypothetical protein